MISILVYIAFFLGLIEVFKFPFLIAKKIKMNKGERESKIGLFRSNFRNNRRNNGYGDRDNRTSDSGRDSYCESNGTGDNYRMVDIFDNDNDNSSNTTTNWRWTT